MFGETHGQAQRKRVDESHPRGSFNYFYGAFLPGFLGPNNFDFPNSETMFGICQEPPMCTCSSLAKMDSIEEAYGQLHHIL